VHVLGRLTPDENQLEVFVVRDPKSLKKPYVAPSFQAHGATAAKAALEAGGASQDPEVEKMLVLINQRLDEKTSTAGSQAPRGTVP